MTLAIEATCCHNLNIASVETKDSLAQCELKQLIKCDKELS